MGARWIGSFVLCVALLASPSTRAANYPSGFSQTSVFTGLTSPTAVRFAADGRVFVAEKRGRVLVFDDLQDATATTVINIETKVHDYWDRGLLGLALDPAFENNGLVYVFYAYDYNPVNGQGPPYWGDTCPDPPGGTDDGCVITGRLARFKVNPDNTLDGGELLLLENHWCQQYPSHSVGGLAFDATGALVLSAGDGASFNWVDYGQGGTAGGLTPKNPCGDPPTGVGGNQSPPGAEGGALRSQDVRSPADPLAFNGAVLRVDPATGAALPDNPLFGGAVSGDDRLIAHGLRNPFRLTVRPGTNEVWVGDVGWSEWEEVDRVASTVDGVVENFGWPCYEGGSKQASYDNANLNLCESLYAQGAAAHASPYYTYRHSSDVSPGGDACPTGDSSIAGLAFYTTGTYPASYENALFFADYSRDCIYVMRAGAGGLPSVATRTAFGTAVNNPVDLQRGPGGDLFYVDHSGGQIRRIRFNAANTHPTAVAAASPTSGNLPLTVQFDGSGSSDPDPGATLFFDWDLDGDGQFDDASLVNPIHTYLTTDAVVVGLRVTDDDGATSTDTVTITPGNQSPSATVISPLPSLLWQVGDPIAFEGQGTDPEDRNLAVEALHWDVILHHCPGGPGDCHEHGVQSFDGTSGGTFVAPDHEWFSYLEFRLTVTDAGGLQDATSVSVDPLTVSYTYDSLPTGLSLSVGSTSAPAPFVGPAIVGSTVTVGADSPQSLGGSSYYWTGWSDGGAQSHDIVVGPTSATLTADFSRCEALEVCDGQDNDCNGTADDVPTVPGVDGAHWASRKVWAWSTAPDAESYDVVLGDLGTLLATGGDFTAATAECLQDDAAGLSLSHALEPAAGQGWWVLVRGSNCAGPGTFDSTGPGQDGPRDIEIGLTPDACP